MATDNFETSKDTVEPEVGFEETTAEEAEAVSEETETPEETQDEAGEEAPETEEAASEEAASEEDPSEEEPKNKKGSGKGHFFKKKSRKADVGAQKIEELTDKWKRTMAEFENFRKRSEKEKSQMYDMGARSMVEKILPVVDSFERGLSGLDEEVEDPFADGMKMVYKQLATALSEAGVEEIEAVGKPFDPDLHNAVMHIDDEAYGENEIVEELQKGYTYHGTVVRYSMVKVAN